MEFFLILKALILGVVEGLTEFLPISSTGHLIVVGDLLNFNGERGTIFEIAIQFGAILAVCWIFRQRIIDVVSGLKHSVSARRFVLNVVVASVPAVVLALIFGKVIKEMFFNPISVALALIIGGFIIIAIERRYAHAQKRTASFTRITTIDQLTVKDAFKVGLAQCVALIPGASRSGSTIMGGMWFGLSRQVATEFSFFLAIPVLFGATLYELFKARHFLGLDDFYLIAVGLIAAFISALACVRWLLNFIATHDFRGFAWYRIIFGVLILSSAWSGLIQWGS